MRHPYWIKISYYFSEKVDPNHHKVNEFLKGQASKIVKWQEDRINVHKQSDESKKFIELRSDDSNNELKNSAKKKKDTTKIKEFCFTQKKNLNKDEVEDLKDKMNRYDNEINLEMKYDRCGRDSAMPSFASRLPKQKSFPKKAFNRGYLSNDNMANFISEIGETKKSNMLINKEKEFYHRISLQKDSTPVFRGDLVGSYKEHSELSERKLSMEDEDESSRRYFNPLFNRSFDEINDGDKKEKSESDVQIIEADDDVEFARKTGFNLSFRTQKILDKTISNSKFGSQANKSIQNGFNCRYNHIKVPPCTYCVDNRLLFNPKKVVDCMEDDWESMIDVPVLPLTTPFLPNNLERDFREMNPSGFDEIKKRHMIELTTQRLTQNFQIVSQNGSIQIDKDNLTMSLCDIYYQIKNKRSNLYIPKTEIVQKVSPTLYYLLYDSIVDSFIPKTTTCSVLESTSLQNFNTDYQDDFSNKDIASVIFPVQQYVIFYLKKDSKQLEELWKSPDQIPFIRAELAKEHYMCFGQYINSIKELISKIPSRSKSNKNINLRVDQNDDWRSFKSKMNIGSNKKKSKKIFFQDDECKEPLSESIECKFTFEIDQYFYPLQGYYISYKWLWCNGPQMYEKIQSINKRAKQYGLTIIQVPYQLESDDIKSFNCSFTLCKAKPAIIQYLFTYDHAWSILNFCCIDKYPTDRLYIHTSGLAFLKIDKKKDDSIVWKENTAISGNADDSVKENIFKRTHAAILSLEIVYEILDKFNTHMMLRFKDFDDGVSVPTQEIEERSYEASEPKLPMMKNRSKKLYSRLRSRDDIIQINSKNLAKKFQKSGSNDYGSNEKAK